MNRLWLALFALLCAVTCSFGDEAADGAALVRRAREMIDATFSGDFTVVLKYMPAATVAAAGGEEAMKREISKVAAQFKEAGLKFITMEVQPPERFHRAGAKTFAVVKTYTVMQMPKVGRISEHGSMVAMREKSGGSWVFVRVSPELAKDRKLLKQVLPGIPDEMRVEPPSPPKVEEKSE